MLFALRMPSTYNTTDIEVMPCDNSIPSEGKPGSSSKTPHICSVRHRDRRHAREDMLHGYAVLCGLMDAHGQQPSSLRPHL